MAKYSCKGCTERWVSETTNCHATCKNYLKEAQKNEEEREHIHKIKKRENDVAECTIANSVKQRRAWKRNGSK